MSAIYQPSLARRIVSRTAAAIGLRYYDVLYCERDLTAPAPQTVPELPVELRVATGNDIEAMAALQSGDERRVVLEIAKRGVGFVAESEGGIIGYAWARAGAMHVFCRRPLEYFELAELPEGVCYTNNSYVLPSHRGRGVFQALLSFQYRDRRAAGFTAVTNLIESVNLDSLAAHRRLGHATQPARIVKLPAQAPKLTYLAAGPSWAA